MSQTLTVMLVWGNHVPHIPDTVDCGVDIGNFCVDSVDPTALEEGKGYVVHLPKFAVTILETSEGVTFRELVKTPPVTPEMWEQWGQAIAYLVREGMAPPTEPPTWMVHTVHC